MDKENLLEQLQDYDYFIVDRNVTLETENKRAIMQTSTYNNVKLHWNGSVFKFWNDKCEDVKMFVNADVSKCEWCKNIITIHIIGCLESVTIKCFKHDNR